MGRDCSETMLYRTTRSGPRPVEYYLLVEPQPHGRLVGYFAGRPIAEFVTDAYGTRYTYAGIAPRRAGGRYDLDALKRDEWLIEPGLVYALAHRESATDRQSSAAAS